MALRHGGRLFFPPGRGNFHYRTSGDFWKRGGSHRGRRKRKPSELLENYLKGCISLLGTAEPARQIKALMITVPRLSAALVKNLYQAGENLGFTKNEIYLQDYDESFYILCDESPQG